MAEEIITISNKEAIQKYHELYNTLSSKRSTTLEEKVKDILNDFLVFVQPKPSIDSKEWLKEKTILCGKLGALIKDTSKKRKSPGETIFFESKAFNSYAKYVPAKVIDPTIEFNTSDLQASDETEYR